MWRTKRRRTFGTRVPLFIWCLSLILALAPASRTLSTFLLFTLPLNSGYFDFTLAVFPEVGLPEVWSHRMMLDVFFSVLILSNTHGVRASLDFTRCLLSFRGWETGRCKSESPRTACADPISRRDLTAVTSWISSCRVRLVRALPGGSRRGHHRTERWRNAKAVTKSLCYSSDAAERCDVASTPKL